MYKLPPGARLAVIDEPQELLGYLSSITPYCNVLWLPLHYSAKMHSANPFIGKQFDAELIKAGITCYNYRNAEYAIAAHIPVGACPNEYPVGYPTLHNKMHSNSLLYFVMRSDLEHKVNICNKLLDKNNMPSL